MVEKMIVDEDDFFVINAPVRVLPVLDGNDDIKALQEVFKNPFQGLVFRAKAVAGNNVAAELINHSKLITSTKPLTKEDKLFSLDLRTWEVETVAKNYAYAVAPNYFDSKAPLGELSFNTKRSKFSYTKGEPENEVQERSGD